MDSVSLDVLQEIFGKVWASDWQNLALVCKKWLQVVEKLTQNKHRCWKLQDSKFNFRDLRSAAMLLPIRPKCSCYRKFIESIVKMKDHKKFYKLVCDCFNDPITTMDVMTTLMDNDPNMFDHQMPDFLHHAIEKSASRYRQIDTGGRTVHALGFDFAISDRNLKMLNTITLYDCAYLFRWHKKILTDDHILAWFLNVIIADKSPRSNWLRVCVMRFVFFIVAIRIEPSSPRIFADDVTGNWLFYCLQNVTSHVSSSVDKFIQQRFSINKTT